MKRVTAFVGSARKKYTYDAVRQFLDDLKALGDVECEIVTLSDYRIETCRGCQLCFEKGEEFCPLKDDRDVLFEKVRVSDGVVLASPNYSFQVSAIMKIFLDRFGFAFHRPRYFGKTSTSIVAQGIYGGNKLVRYLDFVGKGLGFNTVKGARSGRHEAGASLPLDLVLNVAVSGILTGLVYGLMALCCIRLPCSRPSRRIFRCGFSILAGPR